jgi:3-phosphoshikimate 1-carboxyvinyltransferase
MDPRQICSIDRPLDAVLQAVPSKSATHRALIAAALARGRSAVLNPLDADDTRVTRDSLRALGVPIACRPEGWIVDGQCGDLAGGASLRLRRSGTSMRFLLALAALGREASVLDGDPRLRDRPIDELITALRELGAACETAPGGGLPLRIGGSTLHGGASRIAAGRSSQFASALLLIGSTLEQGLDLTLDPPAVSLPYVEMTAETLLRFGARIERSAELRWRVRPAALIGCDYRVEGDHSSASYFLAAPALLGRILTTAGCRVTTGVDWIEVTHGGDLRPFDLDMGASPDLVPTVAVLAVFAKGTSVLRNIAHLRLKESDRLTTVASNLERMGCSVRVGSDSLTIAPGARARGAVIDTASDHRIAMAFAVAGLVVDGMVIDDASCVAKSNAQFWAQLERLSR